MGLSPSTSSSCVARPQWKQRVSGTGQSRQEHGWAYLRARVRLVLQGRNGSREFPEPGKADKNMDGLISEHEFVLCCKAAMEAESFRNRAKQTRTWMGLSPSTSSSCVARPQWKQRVSG